MVKYDSPPQKGAKTYIFLRKKLSKNEKNFKKGIDKGKVMWYNGQAVARRELRDGGTVIEN